MNKILLAIIIYSVLIVGGIVVFLTVSNDKEIKIEQGKENVKKLDNFLKENNHTEEKHGEAGYNHNDELVKMFQDIEQTLSFFVVVLQEEKVDYFTSFFLPQQYSDDMWAYSDDPYLEKVNYKFMRALNRDGTLVSARYDTSLMDGYKKTRKDSEVELILVYEDGKEAKLKLNLVLMGSEHSNNDDIYYFENSVLELIEQIKKQTQ